MKTYRILNIPYELDRDDIKEHFSTDVVIELLAPAANSTDSHTKKVALVTSEVEIKATSVPVKSEVLKRKGLTDRRYLSFVIDTTFLGLTPLNSALITDDIKMDVIAITGLGGHAFGSWEAKNGDYMWLRDSLPHDVRGLRILTYGYQSKLLGSSSYAHIRDYAKELLGALIGARDDNETRRRPLVLLAHSLGGLVVKQALVEAATSGDSSALDLVKSTIGLLFFGVPNRGLSIESLLPMVEGQSNETFVKSLEPDSAFLEILHQNFATSFKFADSEIVSFYETSKSPTAQRQPDGTWKMTGPLDTLVSKASATGSRPLEPLSHDFPINSAHSEMVKFRDGSDGSYTYVRDKIRKFQELGNTTIERRFNSPNDEGKVPQAKNGWTLLHLACDKGNTQKVKSLLDEGFDLQARANNGNTPLHLAAAGGHVTTIQVLLERGAKIEEKNCAGSTALYWACDSGTPTAVKCLLNAGANVEVQIASGWTPLHRASNLGKEETVKILLENGASIKNRGRLSCEPIHSAAKAGRSAIIKCLISNGAELEARADDMSTPLHCASYERHPGAVEDLLNLGANINAKNSISHGYTALCYAAERADTDTVSILLARGADLFLKETGASPLHLAALQGHAAVVEIFLKHNPSLIESISNDQWEYTPLLAAAQKGGKDLVRLLIDHKPPADIEARAKDGSSALHIASRNGQLEIAQLLLDMGANIESRSADLSTPLLAAVQERKFNSATFLLDRGAKINCKNIFEYTPLYASLMFGTEEMVELLLDRGAEIETKLPISVLGKGPSFFGENTKLENHLLRLTPLLLAAYKPNGSNILKLLIKRGANLNATESTFSALHYACMGRHLSAINILLDSGSNVDAKHTWSGLRPIHLAAHHGWDAGLKALLKRGAEVNGKHSSLWTPLCYAVSSGHPSTVKILLENGADPSVKDRLWRTPLYIALD